MVFENRVLTRLLGPKRDEVTGKWRKLHNEELNDLYSPNNAGVNKSRKMRWAGHVGRRGREGAYTVLWWGNLRERDRLGDPGLDGRIILRWIFRKWVVGGKDWIELAQDRARWRDLVNAVTNLRVPQNAGNFLTSLKPVSFSRRTLISNYCHFVQPMQVTLVAYR